MLTINQVQARAGNRAELNKRVLEVQRRLVANEGFTEHRVGEWLNSDTSRHVRMGYAGDEWTLTISDWPAGGYNGVARLRLEPVAQIRLNLRNYDNGTVMPSVEELLALVRQ